MKIWITKYFFVLLLILLSNTIFSQSLNEMKDSLLYYYRNLEYEKGVIIAKRAILKVKNELGENNPEYANFLNYLAGLYLNQGHDEKAEPLYKKVITIRKMTLGDTHPDYASSLNNLAIVYKNMGQHEKAEPLFIQSLEIRKNNLGENHPDYGSGLNNLGTLYFSMMQFEKAESYFIQALEIKKKAFGETHLSYATSLNNLASVYDKWGQYEKAELLYKDVIAIEKTVVGETHPRYAVSLNNLGGLYENMMLYEKAESLCIQVTEIRKKILGDSHPDYARSLMNLATVYGSMGKYIKAETIFFNACQIESNNLIPLFDNLSEKEKRNYLAHKISLNNTSNSFLFNYQKRSNSFCQNNYNLNLSLKSIVLTSTKNTINVVRSSSDTIFQQLFSKWQLNKSALAKQYSLPVADRKTDIRQLEEETEDIEKELVRKSSVFKNQQQSKKINTTTVSKSLNNYEVAIEFVSFNLYNKKWTDSTIYAAYVLSKNDSTPIFVPLFEEKQLQQLLDSAGRSATIPERIFYRGLELKDRNTKLGMALYKLVWQPLEPYLKNAKKISYSPAGKLYSIAFHALPIDSTTLLMDKYQLQQYTSTRQVALRTSEQQTVKPTGITLFGDAIFSLDSLQLTKQLTDQSNKEISTSIYTPSTRTAINSSWADLPGTAEEVKKIKQLFEQNKISTKSFTQRAANEENLKALSDNSPQILHIATHGFFLPEPDRKRKENFSSNDNSYTLADDPLLRSGLILSGGNYAWSGKTPIEGVEDGIATAYEISQLNLSNTELVVLSACETALGDVKGSEGVFGLQRAFKMAGVKKMIVSLWQVPDKETAELMTAFYGYWLKGKTIEQAFTLAQAEMRKKYSPYYWAAFVLVE